MTLEQFIQQADTNLDLIHVPTDVDLAGVEVERAIRSGSGYTYPDSIYYDPLSGKFVELVTIED